MYKLLQEQPWQFTFYQAVRLLLLRGVTVDFRAHATLSYPPSEIQALTIPNGGKTAEMTVNFMGLIGPVGVLPQVWTELIITQNRAGQPELGRFLDIFNSRMIWLYYAAWEKYRFAFALERGGPRNPFLDVLRSLFGTGLPQLQERAGSEFRADGKPAISDAALAWYTGLLSMQTRSAGALEQLLSDYFDVTVQIEQFAPVWRKLPRDVQCCLDDGFDLSTQLGVGAVAGDEVQDASSRVRIRIGPMKQKKYVDFLPGGTALDALRTLTRLFSNELEFDAQLVLAREDVPPKCYIGQGDCRLGWMTWMSAALRDEDVCDTILPLTTLAPAAPPRRDNGMGVTS
jgi:type VI secretion system protein ImpH